MHWEEMFVCINFIKIKELQNLCLDVVKLLPLISILSNNDKLSNLIPLA